MDGTGSSSLGKVLAETGGYFSDLRFSPDGKRIAYFEHPIRFDDRGGVAVVDLSGKRTQLSDGYWAEEGLAWSRDGTGSDLLRGLGYNMFKIFAVDLSGRRRTALESAGGLTILDVSKDRWLTSRDDFFRDMIVLPPNAQKETDLSWLELSYPSAFTPDGKTLLFTEESPTAGPYYSTCIRGTDGSDVVRLGDGTASDISSDGKWALSVVPLNPDKLVVYPMERASREPSRAVESSRTSPHSFSPAPSGCSSAVTKTGRVCAATSRGSPTRSPGPSRRKARRTASSPPTGGASAFSATERFRFIRPRAGREAPCPERRGTTISSGGTPTARGCSSPRDGKFRFTSNGWT